MIRSNPFLSVSVFSVVALAGAALYGTPAVAQNFDNSDDIVSVSVRDVTPEYASQYNAEYASLPSILPTPTPAKKPGSDDDLPPRPLPMPLPGTIGGKTPTTTPGSKPTTGTSIGQVGGKIDIGKIIEIGEKVWDFVINNKPSADYKPLSGDVVPSGITSWTQLRWQKGDVVSKVYRVEFKNIFGGVAGSFDYRVSYIFGGSYQGKGKFIGRISVVPGNIQLHTDRSFTFHAELSAPMNFGTETDPIAATQLLITWSTPTTTRYQMNSAEYLIYGDGDFQDLTNGTAQ